MVSCNPCAGLLVHSPQVSWLYFAVAISNIPGTGYAGLFARLVYEPDHQDVAGGVPSILAAD
jgi:hypothetical protein